MILDSSAIVAILLREPGSDALREKLDRAPGVAVGAPTLVETSIVLSSRTSDSRHLMARFLLEAGVAVVPFTDAHFGEAAGAWLRFGKGRHPAALNFGDCLTYAVARLSGEPLLCTGEDFARTDLPLA